MATAKPFMLNREQVIEIRKDSIYGVFDSSLYKEQKKYIEKNREFFDFNIRIKHAKSLIQGANTQKIYAYIYNGEDLNSIPDEVFEEIKKNNDYVIIYP